VFIDRTDDLRELESRWGLRPQLYLLWGRRRVGKSALIREFARGKDAILYQAVTGTAVDQLALLSRRIRAWRDDPLLAAAPFANWEQAFAYLENLGRQRKAKQAPLLLVLDEFQYLDASDRTITSRLQDFLETVKHEDLPLFVVVAGSAISFFEDKVLIGSVFGRRTAGGLLAPLGYADACSFFPEWSPIDRIRAWGILGGMPYYLEQFDSSQSLEWNICERMLRRNQVLYNEAELLLRDELRDAPTYQSVLAAIADGESKLSDIHARTKIPATSLTPILGRLSRLHLVARTVPIGEDEARSKRGLWTISDNYLAFWFAFIRPNLVDLEAGRGREVWNEDIAPRLDEFVSQPAFERLCREFVRSRIGRDARFPKRGDVGAWWGPATFTTPQGIRTGQREAEIVVASGRSISLIGEAKWSDGPVDLEALAQLRATASVVPGVSSSTLLAVFARESFTDRLRGVAARESVILVTAAEMLARIEDDPG
jgi:AAA+ ATPase superfamily predicted ATPase